MATRTHRIARTITHTALTLSCIAAATHTQRRRSDYISAVAASQLPLITATAAAVAAAAHTRHTPGRWPVTAAGAYAAATTVRRTLQHRHQPRDRTLLAHDALTIAHWNTLFSVSDATIEQQINYLRIHSGRSTDIIALHEPTDTFVDHFDELASRYGFTGHHHTADDGTSLHLYLRRDNITVSWHPLTGNLWAAQLTVTSRANNHPDIDIWIARPAAPTVPRTINNWDESLRALTRTLRNRPVARPSVLIGDLNITPWHRHMIRLEQTGYRTAGTIRDTFTNTWRPRHHLGILGAHLDHVLVSGHTTARIQPAGYGHGPYQSDHKLRIITVTW
jgi:endonuclease/exonuclease/phosphatase (EEP) superfamily protein YafD